LGGWGYLLGDEGSGYAIGQQGMMAAIRAFEEMGPGTSLTAAFEKHFNIISPRESINLIYSPDYKPADIAQFAPYVLQEAFLGDKIANGIVEQALDTLSGYAINLLKIVSCEGCPVGVYGGIFEHHPRFVDGFAQRVKRIYPDVTVGFPQLPPYLGAVAYYFSKQKNLTQQVMTNLLASQPGRKEN
jgi:N-acetylglucosamine kinase